MDHPIKITALDNPKIKAIVKLRKQRQRNQQNLFIAQGLREITRALQANLTPHQFFFCQALLTPDDQAQIKQWQSNTKSFELSVKAFNKIAGIENPQGILATFKMPTHDFETITKQANQQSAKPPLWLIAVGIEKPGNLGALARSALAAGATGLLVVDAICDIFNPNAIRSSTGAVFSLPITACTTTQAIDFLQANQITAYATTPAATKPYWDIDWNSPSAIVIGPEDKGLPQKWLDQNNDHIKNITIPMAQSAVDSLNASVAAGAVLFEAQRQRTQTAP